MTTISISISRDNLERKREVLKALGIDIQGDKGEVTRRGVKLGYAFSQVTGGDGKPIDPGTLEITILGKPSIFGKPLMSDEQIERQVERWFGTGPGPGPGTGTTDSPTAP